MNDNKKQQLAKRMEVLIEYTFEQMEKYSKGHINESQMDEVLYYIDSMHEEIQSEIEMFVLIDSVCLN